MQKVQLAIARRVHELFEARGPEHGNDLEDSFRAREATIAARRLANSQMVLTGPFPFRRPRNLTKKLTSSVCRISSLLLAALWDVPVPTAWSGCALHRLN